MQTKTEILIEATQRLAASIDSIDGVANAVIFEAAQRLDELQTALQSAHASLVLARNERDEARAESERLKTELAQAISERTPHDYGLLKYTIEALKEELHESREELAKVKRESVKTVTVSFPGMPTSSGGGGGRACGNNHLPEAEKMVSQEPSRLEIAAMILASSCSHPDRDCGGGTIWALEYADALIAAAKEGQ